MNSSQSRANPSAVPETQNFASTQPSELSELSASFVDPSWTLRILYCVALATLIVGQFAMGGWIGMAFGGGALGYAGPGLFSVIVIAALYRIYFVLRYKHALRTKTRGMVGRALRILGQAIMILSLVALSVLIFRGRLGRLLFGSDGGTPGIVGFVLGMYAAVPAMSGWLGCLVFDAGRNLGAGTLNTGRIAASRNTKQNIVIFALISVVVFGVPFALKSVRGEPCYGTTVLRCIGTVQGGVVRPVVLAVGEAVKLESNIEEIVFQDARGVNRAQSESPSTSLMKAGHPVDAGGDSKIVVRVFADRSKEGVLIKVSVSDAKGEAASFVTTIPKIAKREPGNVEEFRVVIDLPQREGLGLMFATANDSGSGKQYVLDELFGQLRQAIVSPREFEEIAKRVERRAILVSSKETPKEKKLADSILESCRGKVTLEGMKAPETSLESGRPLHELVFPTSTGIPKHVVSRHRDRIGCNADGVWLIASGRLAEPVDLRRYSSQGDLLDVLRVTLPGTSEFGVFLDADSARIEGKNLIFEGVAHEVGKRTTHRFEVAM